ncbi:MAG: SpoIIE family protein phosphatase [Limnospira sp. PMC 1291.21]|uniref:Protein serine/threonine phosphatase n=2 Tax=Limnospira TaxID=2596745 RepID=B5W0T5_LIMMA|nr:MULTISPECIES: SpoIIE family protein phosphatase [Limnospira]EKD08051.1 protein serine/threonine phosphatase [Arthrospira platensis C1]MDC0836312.1 SpoIIE family protein phosphatase [Limnoraphis robusta]MDY7054098.1 SpoIIE family protein phosphatase [Limnospira fusiformis LS22]QJB25354.1 SpoIIE family protein phosphatase [Limnospira fusiformis SAG 85.79]EDZ94735.1 protein serine/threonine phosphatase [Limnospira maxima CS-328]
MGQDNFFDICDRSLNKKGEELCGDQVKFTKTETKSTIVLSDGLGSGVKANILATLTTEILITMLNADVPLEEVIKTVIGTLPICQVRHIAYATFTIIQIDHQTNQFKVINFDNPPVFYFNKGRVIKLDTKTEKILGKKILSSEGQLERGDFLGAISDGVLYAGLGDTMNFGWGWDNIAKYMEKVFMTQATNSRSIIEQVMAETRSLYRDKIGDDATFVGIYVRKRNPVMIFTGPPLDITKDELYAERLLSFKGRKVICGGTTGNLVANYMGETIEMDISTMRKDLPPIGKLSEIDLVTEGILTISKATAVLRQCNCDITRLPSDQNGAVLLAREILEADSIFLLVGQQINEFYQNPLLPKNISIRRSLIEDLVNLLKQKQKEVTVEYC